MKKYQIILLVAILALVISNFKFASSKKPTPTPTPKLTPTLEAIDEAGIDTKVEKLFKLASIENDIDKKISLYIEAGNLIPKNSYEYLQACGALDDSCEEVQYQRGKILYEFSGIIIKEIDAEKDINKKFDLYKKLFRLINNTLGMRDFYLGTEAELVIGFINFCTKQKITISAEELIGYIDMWGVSSIENLGKDGENVVLIDSTKDRYVTLLYDADNSVKTYDFFASFCEFKGTYSTNNNRYILLGLWGGASGYGSIQLLGKHKDEIVILFETETKPYEYFVVEDFDNDGINEIGIKGGNDLKEILKMYKWNGTTFVDTEI